MFDQPDSENEYMHQFLSGRPVATQISFNWQSEFEENNIYTNINASFPIPMDETSNDSISCNFQEKLTFTSMSSTSHEPTFSPAEEEIMDTGTGDKTTYDFGNYGTSSHKEKPKRTYSVRAAKKTVPPEEVQTEDNSASIEADIDLQNPSTSSTNNSSSDLQNPSTSSTNNLPARTGDSSPTTSAGAASPTTSAGAASPTTSAGAASSATTSTVVDKASSKKSAAPVEKKKRKRTNREKVLTRKRRKLEHSWIDVKAKKARNAGIAGEGRKGKEIQERTMGRCASTCRFKCRTKISKKNRKKAFTDFWSLEDKASQWQCINNWLKSKHTKSGEYSSDEFNYDTDSETEMKKKKYQYTLPSPTGAIVVCRTMFLKTLSISHQWVETAQLKKIKGDSTQLNIKDNRGRHTNRPHKLLEVTKERVRDHISSFPVMESHYCRENSTKEYLEEGLNISLMYRLYKEKMEAEGFVCTSHQSYERIFNTEFNYGFFKPKKDRCEQCERFSNLSPSEKTREINKNHAQHISNKKKARELMKAAQEEAEKEVTICSAVFDLQKILSTPKAEIGPLYYMSKLCVWNFTIFELATHLGHCNVWNETIGCRGSNEIASFLYKFIKSKSEAGVQEFLFFSDNCGGQNRNRNVFSMFIKASIDLKIKITHRFLEVGHTQNPGDSMHSCIERHSSKKDVFSQGEWCRLIQESKTKNPYIVTEITQKEIFNFDEFSKYFRWNKIKISSVREICVQNIEDYVNVSVKYDFTQNEEKFQLLKKTFGWAAVKRYQLPKAYKGQIPLSEKKAEDLQAMITRRMIPSQFHNFYNQIL